MMTLSQEQANTAWVQFYTVFERIGLSKHYDMDKLKTELLSSPCAITEDMGTAYKGALLMHINMVMALAQRMTKMISGTFQMDEDSLLKVCCIMHLSKRYMYVENENEWEIKNRGMLFKFAKDMEGCLKGGERSALEALNNGVHLSPIEFEAIKALDEEDNTIQNLTESSSNLYCWGFGKYGQVGKQFINYSIDPIYIQLEYETQDDDIFQLYSGENHNAILTFNITNNLYYINNITILLF